MINLSRDPERRSTDPLLQQDVAFNRHSLNDGSHNSPLGQGQADAGTDNITVKLIQELDEESFQRVAGRAVHSTTGINPEDPPEDLEWEEMLKGGLQTALETQVIVFEVAGVSRACTHQLVRTRKASFHQQSQRATFMGDQPNVRIPETVFRNERARAAFLTAILKSWEAYQVACDEDIAYQDARFILPEGTEAYILCEYSLREFINTYAYRGCSMFLWETVHVFREMRRILVEAHPWLDPYVKIGCQDRQCPRCEGAGQLAMIQPSGGTALEVCRDCAGTGWVGTRCTFQGWENVEEQCTFPQAKEELRTYRPGKTLRIGGK